MNLKNTGQALDDKAATSSSSRKKFELHINKHYVISFDTILPLEVVKMVKDVQPTIQRVHQSFAFCFRLMPVKAEFRIGGFMISTNLDIFVSLFRFETSVFGARLNES